MLIRYENVLSQKDFEHIQDIILSPRWAWGHTSNPSDQTSFWEIYDLENDPFFSEHLFNQIKEKTGDNLQIERIYMNGQTSELHGTLHQDTKQENGRTFLIYCTPNWNPQHGGGTMFVADGETATVAYKPNSAIYFQGNIYHCAAPISKAFNGLRVTLAFKLFKV